MTASVIIDLIIAAALLLFAYLGWKRGLVRTLSELLAVVLALFLANQIATYAAPKVVDTFLRPAAHEAIEERVEELYAEGNLDGDIHDGARQLLESIPISFVRKQAMGLLEKADFSVAVSYTKAAVLELGRKAVDTALDTVVRNLVRSIIFAVCFAVLTFLLRLAVKALDLTFSLPGLKQLNEFGGMLIGLCKGLVVVCLAVWVLSLAGILTEEVVVPSYLLRLAAGVTGVPGGAEF